ncbi:SDR family oxidoreductase [Ascidiimonas sp. W6]|uniref:SDR family oxidoreductase n=1 Tax=Ascidiimonas meishanensis TaxID=3128903 RepID=UPI0030EE5FA9
MIREKVIWITGASSGIGEALAYELSKYDNKIILSARRESELQKVRSQCLYPENIRIVPLDLLKFEQMETYVKLALECFGSIDILINNGGISQRSLIAETSFLVDKQIMETDYLGTIALTKALLPHFLAKKQGYYVTVTSLMGKFGTPYRSSYCGAKHALHGFFDVLRMEHEKDGIDVTLICPGFVNTNVAKNALTGSGKKQVTNDKATQNGLSPEVFSTRMIKAMKKKKFEAYIGRKEILGVYLKRFFPRYLHRFVLKSTIK